MGEVIRISEWRGVAKREPALVPALVLLWGFWPCWMLMRVNPLDKTP